MLYNFNFFTKQKNAGLPVKSIFAAVRKNICLYYIFFFRKKTNQPHKQYATFCRFLLICRI